jgi:hypothetical protein
LAFGKPRLAIAFRRSSGTCIAAYNARMNEQCTYNRIVSHQGRKFCAEDALCFGTTRMGSHDRLTHAKNFKADVFTLAIAIKPKADDVRPSGCIR